MKTTTQALHFFSALTHLHNSLSKKLDRSLGAIHGIGVSEFLVMHHLHGEVGQVSSRIALADAVGLTASGVTRLLNPMEKTGLVQKQKNAKDARVSLVKLSSSGAELYSNARTSFESAMANALGEVSEPELISLTGSLHQLR